jgi:hypothetical protein
VTITRFGPRHAAALMLALATGLAACGQPAASPTIRPSATGSISTSTSPPDTETTAPAPSEGTQVSQTDTDWGRIWDEVPDTFPTIAGATPGGASAHGPASADLVVEGRSAKDIVDVLQTQLEQVGFATAGNSGPLEDGGYVLDLTGEATGCLVQVTVSPLGGLTSVTVLYGAACPFA